MIRRSDARLALLALGCMVLTMQLAFIAREYESWLGLSDFVEYWGAGQLLRQGQNPYDADALYSVQRQIGWDRSKPLLMWNPPWLLVLIYPLLMVPYGLAATIWFGLSLALIVACAVMIWRLFAPPLSSARPVPPRLVVSITPALAAMVFAPAVLTLRIGQVSAMLLLGVVGFLHCERSQRYFLAGASLSLLTFKPHVTYLLWPVLLWWIVNQRRWKVLWGLAAALLLLCLPLTMLRPTWHLEYWHTLQEPPLYWRASVAGTVLRMVCGWQYNWLQYLPSLVLVPLSLAVLHRQRDVFSWGSAMGPLLVLSVPTAPYGWSFDQLVLLVPYLQVLAWVFQRNPGRLWWRAGVAAGLPLISGLTLWMNSRLGDDLYLLVGGVAWGLLYLIARSALKLPELSAA